MKLFDMLTNADIQRIKAQGDLGKRVTELENKLKESGRINQLHQELIEKLKEELARAKEEHQYDNLVHQKEVQKLLEKF